MLYYLLQNCFLTRLEIFAIADCVVNRLQQDDPVLFKHMVEAMQNNVAFDPREFLVNFIHHEKERAMAMAKNLQANSQSDRQESNNDDDDDAMQSDARSLLSHPIIFMRKWIGEVSGNQRKRKRKQIYMHC